MWEKLFAVLGRIAEIAPTIITDAEGAASAIKAQPHTVNKIEAGLTSALEGLEALFPPVGR